MIKTPTVLILGAGASMPYGFPSGRELFDLITEKVNEPNKDPAFYIILRNKFPDLIDSSIGLDFYESDASSIDEFVNKKPKYTSISKFITAYLMILHENSSNLLSRSNPNNWYRLLKDQMMFQCPLEKFHENDVSIITFNYDRSLEEYLATTLSAFYDEEYIKYYAQLENMDIFHVYGSLGPLAWQPGSQVGFIDYQADDYYDVKYIEKCAQNIKTINEARDSDNIEIQRAIECLKRAQRIYFLGFGFHPDNIEILEMGEWENCKDIRATCKGLPVNARNYIWIKIQELSGRYGKIDLNDKNMKDFLIDTDNYEFLHNRVPLA